MQKLDVGPLLIEQYSKFQKNPPLLIFHSVGESPTINHFAFLKSLKLLHPDVKILHITTGWEYPQAEYTTITDCATFFWPMTKLWNNSMSTTATHHFVAMARTPRSGRTRIINSILNKNLQQYGYFSIGAGAEFDVSSNFYSANRQKLGIDEANLKYFPSYIDGPVHQYLGKSYEMDDDKIKNALVHVVLETGFEHSTDLPMDRPWSVPMLTEKTVKAFALGQIPFILGPLGQVEKTRQQGFDLFDDLVDHSYDTEADPLVRIEKLVNSLDQFINNTPQFTLQHLKESLMPRFISNSTLAKKLAYGSEWPKIQEFLDSLGTNIDE
jgi:hypothetical protein